MRDRGTSTVFVLRVMGVIAVLAVAVGLIMVVNADAGSIGTARSDELGWLAPIVAASVIGAVAWLLLGQETRGHETRHRSAALPTCPDCGRAVLDQWRMCPYCGEMLEDEVSSGPAPTDS